MFPSASIPIMLPLYHSGHLPQTAFYGSSCEYVFSAISVLLAHAAQGPYLIHGSVLCSIYYRDLQFVDSKEMQFKNVQKQADHKPKGLKLMANHIMYFSSP